MRLSAPAVPRIVPVDADLPLAAARLRARPRPRRLPDALVATGEVHSATMLAGDRTSMGHSDRRQVG